ncbi:MAG: 3-phosphoshikimate 1-carboxyvinyltransferase [Prevotella sp.]|nr:3-phosphoshikimate 1-carboxyvinyltransferase [Prevotella sp.]MDD6670263.1 3-phosphoshikimate 1-carboxyvinyltransferase [Prevotella sp.]
MKYIVTAPKTIDVTIDLPSSKSICNRALVMHALAGGGCLPDNLSDCDDTDVMVKALCNNPDVIDIKAAGTAMRFLTAYYSVGSGEHLITGTERMRHRPIGLLVDALRYLGAEIEYADEDGFPPLLVRGKKLEGGPLEMPGNVSSQYISALLMIGPALSKGIELHLKGNIVSRPYIDLTLWMMREYGADAEWTDVDTITVKPKPYVERRYLVENDWSAASYWYEILALCNDRESTVRLTGLTDGSKQGDSIARYISSLLGVKTAFAQKKEGLPTTVTLTRHIRTIPRLDYDFISSPDLAQTYVAACCAMGLPFHFKGLASLKIKETDRIEALKNELRKLGYVVKDRNNSELIWDGERCAPTGEPIDTYEDHRMAMAFAPLAMTFGKIEINDPQVVTKSYPRFWDDLKAAGFIIEEA